MMMMMLKKFVAFTLFLVLILPTGTAYGQQATPAISPDSVCLQKDPAISDYMQKLDSLYEAWLNNHLPLRSYQDTILAFTLDTNIIDLPDSVFIKRLAAIPSAIELTYNKQVRSYLDLYTKTRKKQVSVMLGLADYYFPMIESKLDAHGLPLELKYLPVIESALNPQARSRVGAMGMWQFMLGTSRLYKLTVNSYVDERLDPERSTEQACIYLKELYSIFGDWHMVIAAYNCGPGNMKKAIQRSGGKTNYWDVYYYLPVETRGFVPAFIAATYIMNYSQNHGFCAVKPAIPIRSDTVLINHELHLAQVSEVLGIDMNILQQLNPKYRRKMIPAGGGPYDLRLPADKISAFIALEDSVQKYKQDVYLAKNNLDKQPEKPAKSKPVAVRVTPGVDDEAIIYTVKSGDNLGMIAAWHEVTVSAIKDWNGLSGSFIRAGQKLTLYVPKAKSGEIKEVNDMTFAEKQARIGKENGTGQSGEPAAASETGDYVLYTVRSGDNLWTIAQKYPGVTHEDIMKLNQMSSSKLQAGRVLKIKRKEG